MLKSCFPVIGAYEHLTQQNLGLKNIEGVYVPLNDSVFWLFRVLLLTFFIAKIHDWCINQRHDGGLGIKPHLGQKFCVIHQVLSVWRMSMYTNHVLSK